MWNSAKYNPSISYMGYHYRNKKRPKYPVRQPSSAFYFTRVRAAEQTDKIIKTLLSNMSMFILCAQNWGPIHQKLVIEPGNLKNKETTNNVLARSESYPGCDNKKTEEDYQVRSQHQQQKQVKCNTGNLQHAYKQSTPFTMDCCLLLSSSFIAIFPRVTLTPQHSLGP